VIAKTKEAFFDELEKIARFPMRPGVAAEHLHTLRRLRRIKKKDVLRGKTPGRIKALSEWLPEARKKNPKLVRESFEEMRSAAREGTLTGPARKVKPAWGRLGR
jgi:hypothetical protein